MTALDADGHVRMALSLYALGALPDEEQRAAVKAHLAGCAICRTELDQQFEVTLALALLSREDAEALMDSDPQPQATAPTPARPHQHGNRIARWLGPLRRGVALGNVRIAVAAGVLALSIGLGTGVVLRSGGPEDGALAAASVDDRVDGLSMNVAVYARKSGGYTLQARFAGLTPDTAYSLALVTADQRSHPLGSWTATAPVQILSADVTTPVGDMAYFALNTSDGALVLMAYCRPTGE